MGGPKGGNVNSGATLSVQVAYSFFHMNFKALRRSQRCHFITVGGDNHSQHWAAES
jgi:hypothetical protein